MKLFMELVFEFFGVHYWLHEVRNIIQGFSNFSMTQMKISKKIKFLKACQTVLG